LDLTLLEPESDFLLGILDAVGAVADITSNVDGEVAGKIGKLAIAYFSVSRVS
jgi:hypothetical protein